MVVAVSLRKASDPSYSSIVGAGERPSVSTDHASLYQQRNFDIFKMGTSWQYPTWNIRGHVQCDCLAEPFGGGRTYRELICDAWVELGKEVIGGIGGQGYRQSWLIKRHWRVKRMQAAVADLSWRRNRECWFVDVSQSSKRCLAPYNLGNLILYDDSIGFRGFLPVKQDSVFRWSSSQRLTGNRTWNC